MLLNSRGKTRTIFQHNGHRDVNEINWDANYDGDAANVSLEIKDNGKRTHKKNLHLTNENLASLLSVPSVEGSLDQRLIKDFQLPRQAVVKYPIRKKTRSKRSKVNRNKKKKNSTRSKRNNF
jgi:hypothetical protein